MAKYIKNADLEKALLGYLETGDKLKYDETCVMLFKISKKLVYWVISRRKFKYDKFMVDDLISAGTQKAIKEMHKFSKTGKHKESKAFSFFTMVIINEMTHELMKQERKNWYRDDEKIADYLERATYKNIVRDINELKSQD